MQGENVSAGDEAIGPDGSNTAGVAAGEKPVLAAESGGTQASLRPGGIEYELAAAEGGRSARLKTQIPTSTASTSNFRFMGAPPGPCSRHGAFNYYCAPKTAIEVLREWSATAIGSTT